MADDGLWGNYRALAAAVLDFAIADYVAPIPTHGWRAHIVYPTREFRGLYPNADGDLCKQETRDFFNSSDGEFYAEIADSGLVSRGMYRLLVKSARVRRRVRCNLRELRSGGYGIAK